MEPTVGRTVHYYEGSQGPLAAVITRAGADGTRTAGFVDLAVFRTTGGLSDLDRLDFVRNMQELSPSGKDFTGKTGWCWPPRV